jgi:hypothetical protein
MQPQLLFVEGCRIFAIAKEEAVFDQDRFGGTEFESGVFSEQLMRENKEIQGHSLKLG